MPFALVAPKAGRSPFWRVRGTEYGIAINRSTRFGDKASALKLLKQWRDEAKRQHLAAPDETRGLTFASAALAYIRADGENRFLAPLLLHFRDTPLAKIDQAAIDAAAVEIYPNGSPATRNRQVYSPVSALMRHAGVLKPLRRPKGAHDGRRLDWLRPEEAFAHHAGREVIARSIASDRFRGTLKEAGSESPGEWLQPSSFSGRPRS
jgi:hypothetical protein